MWGLITLIFKKTMSANISRFISNSFVFMFETLKDVKVVNRCVYLVTGLLF